MWELKGKYNTAKICTENIDEKAISQILELCNQEWVSDSNIVIMPDVHAGKGCTIGTTMTIVDKVCPNLVGVDLGCGMLTVKIPKEISFTLEELDKIVNCVPSGFNVNEESIMTQKDKDDIGLENLVCYKYIKDKEYIEKSLGSLGSGNHFIEVDEGSDGNKYLIIHSGSRNLGKQVAEYYQDLAIERCNKRTKEFAVEKNKIISQLKEEGHQEEIQDTLMKFKEKWEDKFKKLPSHLCYLTGQDMNNYLHDCKICQTYATYNRRKIAYLVLKKLVPSNITLSISDKQIIHKCSDGSCLIVLESFETIHNYINFEDQILRKGSIRALKGEKVLIPINMRDGCILGIGKGNSEYNYSAPHGAGRTMSRSEAKESITLDEFKQSMDGIYSTSVVQSTIDESPMAYKSIDSIIDNIEETIDIVDILKPIYNFKAH